MIATSMQLKAKIRNLSGGDNDRALVLIRTFIMERFLERVALSPYKDKFILKGGMLVAAMVGLEARATMDIDTTMQALPLTMQGARKVIEEIIRTDVQDGVSFTVTKASEIMEEHDYPGIRFMLEASLDNLRQVIKIDISTGDVITPHPVSYSYRLMFEDRVISLWSYNLETLLGEKLETIMARETANTRMRDFYDVHVLTRQAAIDYRVLRDAFMATSRKRGTTDMLSRFDAILDEIRSDPAMLAMWEKYRRDNFFVGELTWGEANESVKRLVGKMWEVGGKLE